VRGLLTAINYFSVKTRPQLWLMPVKERW